MSGGGRAFRGLLAKETRHVLRDRRTLLVVLLMPLVQVVLFGYAIQNDVEEVRLLVVGAGTDPGARALVGRFAAAPTYRVVGALPSTDALPDWFRRSRADQALVFPPGFSRRASGAGGAGLLLVTDAASPIAGRVSEAYARAVVERWLREDAAASGAGAGPRPVGVRTRYRFNPTLESQLVFVPGLLAFVLTIISALMTAVTLSREKETGTLEALLVSPLRPASIILGKVLPYVALAFFNAVTTLTAAWLLFGVPVRGSLPLLLGESLLFVTVALSIGVLVSTVAPSQRVAMLGVILGTMLPTALLSGMIFPVSAMPPWLRPLTHVVPAKWFIRVVRGVMLKEAGLDVLWPETLILAGMAAVLLAVSVRAFRDRLE